MKGPIYPDPATLPVPDPIFHQIVSRPPVRAKKEQLEFFKIITPKILYKEDYLEHKKAA